MLGVAISTATITLARCSRTRSPASGVTSNTTRIATAGDFVYETPGEGHTLVVYESDEIMLVHFNVTGPLIWLDEDGEPSGFFDAHSYIALCKEHYERVGIGADYIETLFR